MKYIVPILIVIIIILIAALSFSVGKSGFSISKTETPNPTQTQEVSVTPTSAEIETTKVKGGGILAFPNYELSVPAGWVESRESFGADDEKLTVSKGSYKISISQGGFGGSMCLYPGDPDSEGPSGRYAAFLEITTQSGDLFRRGFTGSELAAPSFGICQKGDYGWQAPTLYGHISYIVPTVKTKEMLNEMDLILASLKKI